MLAFHHQTFSLNHLIELRQKTFHAKQRMQCHNIDASDIMDRQSKQSHQFSMK